MSEAAPSVTSKRDYRSVAFFALVERYKRSGAFGLPDLLVHRAGWASNSLVLLWHNPDLEEFCPDDASGPALAPPTLYSLEHLSLGENTRTLTHTLVLCPDTMSCSRRRGRYDTGESGLAAGPCAIPEH